MEGWRIEGLDGWVGGGALTGNKFIPDDIFWRALGHEDVGLVEENDGVPFRRHLEDFLDLFAEFGGVGA